MSNPTLFRLRVTYAKTGVLRYLAHRELMRALERMICRSKLPFALTNGFNAHMRLATALALPVGTAGLAELIDIWLSDYVAPAHALYMLKSAAVPGIEPIACEYVAKDERSLQDTYVLADYTITLALGEHSVEDAQRALVSYVDGGVLTIMKKRREKSYDLKEQLITYGIEQSEGHRAVLTMTLKSLSTGAIRPEWLLDAAFSETPGVRAESITRTALRADQTLTY